MIWKWLRRHSDSDDAVGAQRIQALAKPASTVEQLGRTDAICPHCERTLAKKPGRKTKCPHCGYFIYVRTRPTDRQRVLVTETEAAQIETQWEIIRETSSLEELKEHYSGGRKAFERERTALTAKFGRQPSDRDVHWSLLNKQLIEHSSQGNWGLYRNARFNMAEVLHADGRLQAALATYLEVCYLDLNGPRNMGGTTVPEILQEYPPFSPEENFLAPGVLRRADSIMKQLVLDQAQARSLFLNHVQKYCGRLNLPVSFELAWPRIEKELFGPRS